MEHERFITSTLNRKDVEAESTLRPQTFGSFPGQTKTKDRLEIYVSAARNRSEPLGHLLLSGPPGLGKTTLAYIIANEKGANIKTSSGPVIEKPGDLAGLLTSLEKGDILFIDEIHRLNTAVEEYLYSAMEDFFIDIMIDQGPGARSVRLNIPEFTLIGATTRQGLLSAPLRSRFELSLRLDYYSPEELQDIVLRSAGILHVSIDPEGALEIARRSRGTPRIANNLLRWTRDYAQVRGSGTINRELAAAALTMLYLLLFFLSGVLLCCVDGVTVRDALFETASAIGTVGLSMGITPQLSRISQFALILLMYFGRVGGLTLLYAVAGVQAVVPAQAPQERVTIG